MALIININIIIQTKKILFNPICAKCDMNQSVNNLKFSIWKVLGFSSALLQIAKIFKWASSTTKYLNFRLFHHFCLLIHSFFFKSAN